MPDHTNAVDPNPVTSAVLFAVARHGHVVNIRQGRDLYVATAYRNDETFVARAPDAMLPQWNSPGRWPSSLKTGSG